MRSWHTHEQNDDEDGYKPVREDNTESYSNSDPKHEHGLEQKGQVVVYDGCFLGWMIYS